MSHWALSRSLRILALACAAAMPSGCAFNVWENISPDPEGYWDIVNSVTSAAQRDDGSVVICVNGYPASLPAPNEEFILEHPEEAFSLILPADTKGHLAADDAHPSLRRYDLTSADVAGACADSAAPGTPVPVHAFSPEDLGYRDFTNLKEIHDALTELFDTRTGTPAVHVYTWAYGHEIIYVAPEARFDGARAVLIEPGRRPVKGNPAYVLLLPFAVVFDVFVAMPVFIFAVATGIYDG